MTRNINTFPYLDELQHPADIGNAAATFQRLIDSVLCDIEWKTYLSSFDDIIIFSTTFHGHLLRLNLVLPTWLQHVCTLQQRIVVSHAKASKVFGHVNSKDGIRPDPDKVSAFVYFLSFKTENPPQFSRLGVMLP